MQVLVIVSTGDSFRWTLGSCGAGALPYVVTAVSPTASSSRTTEPKFELLSTLRAQPENHVKFRFSFVRKGEKAGLLQMFCSTTHIWSARHNLVVPCGLYMLLIPKWVLVLLKIFRFECWEGGYKRFRFKNSYTQPAFEKNERWFHQEV